MKYTKENIKYCLFAEPDWMRQSYSIPRLTTPPFRPKHLPYIMHSGLTQWGKVFDGYYNVPDYKELDHYNVIHVNYTPSNVGKLRYLKKLIGDRDIKIVVNIDHSIDLWGMNGFVEIHQMLDELNLADCIFAVEKVMADTVSCLLDRKVYCIPHPTDTKMIRDTFFKLRNKRKDEIAIAVFFHSYDKNWLLITNLLNKLKKEQNILAVAIGALDGYPAVFRNTFDLLYNRVSFSDAMKVINNSDVVIDTAVTHSYGRVPVECACLETPCITDHKVDSGSFLFPKIQHDIFNILEVKQAIYDAAEICDFDYYEYSFDKSAKKFLNMLNGGD